MHASNLCFNSHLIHNMEMETSSKQMKPHVAILPSPAMGHIIPLTDFARRLVLSCDFTVTFIIPDYGFPIESQKSFLDSLPETINVVYLPPPESFDDPPGDFRPEIRITTGMTRCVPALRDSLKALTESNHLVALVVDVVGTDAFDVAQEFGLLRYLFIPLCATSLSLFFYLSKSGETGIRDLTEQINIPGSISLPGTMLPQVIQNTNSEFYKMIIYQTKRYNLADGIIINSFLDLEPGTFKVLMEEGSGKPPIYPVGPLFQTGPTSRGSSSGYDDSECLRFLDEQPSGSVLFVCFGSSGTLSDEQLSELALGLEMSEQRFIWVVRRPAKNGANAVYYNAQEEDPFNFLPKGFLERTRTRGLGLLVRSWAPQVQILSHGSTGGFVCHCGWNSVIETLTHGVPIIVWPLFAEQEMHAVMLTQELKVALRPMKDENGVVGREEIAKNVRGLIVGEEGKLLRNRARELKDAAAKATSPHGSSTKTFDQVIHIFRNHKPSKK